jgi:SAM-dependent methyltransferase
VANQRPAPTEIDATIPNGARIYDFMLGGKDNFASDQAAAEQMIEANPAAPLTARANRAFLGRAVRYLARDEGIRQFLDLGTGLPTQHNVHQAAQQVTPDARVVYVDYDPVVVMHGRALLANDDTVTVIEGDLRQPEEILTDPGTRRLIDFDEPVAVLLVAILHFIGDDDDPAGIVARLRDAMAPGSYLVVSHTASESPTAVMAAAQQGFRLAGAPLTPRTRDQVRRFFDGYELVDPGVVEVSQWRPPAGEPATTAPSAWTIVGGVGRKR